MQRAQRRGLVAPPPTFRAMSDDAMVLDAPEEGPAPECVCADARLRALWLQIAAR